MANRGFLTLVQSQSFLSISSKKTFCTATSKTILRPISAFVNKNVENLERKENFVPGHQHHQHGMTGGGGHSHGGGGGHSHGGQKQGGYLLNGSRTVNDQRPSPSKPKDVTVMAQRDSRR
jgi:hypothetical protein